MAKYITKTEIVGISNFYCQTHFIASVSGTIMVPCKGSRKKSSLLVARPLRPLAPPPRLNGHRNFFPCIKKKYFFLSGTPV